MRTRAPLLAVVLVALPGCDGAKYEPPQVVPVLPDAAVVGTIRGEVRYDGPLPEKKLEPMGGSAECSTLNREKVFKQDLLVKEGRLRWAFVYLKQGLDPRYKFPIPAEEHVVANEKCLYTPRVSGARAWQKIKLLNQDPTQHNFKSDRWSRTLNNAGQSTTVWFEQPQIMVPLRCDLHNWMIGWLGILDHPYFAVTDEQGAFEVKGVPPGEYVVEAWQEVLGTQSQTVKLGPKDTATATFTFKK